MKYKEANLLDWLKIGTDNSLISFKKAKDIYEAMSNQKIKQADFEKLLYEI